MTPVTSNSGIEAAGSYAVTRTRVGSPYVIAGMDEANAAGKANVMGFEANGGTLTASRFTVEENLSSRCRRATAFCRFSRRSMPPPRHANRFRPLPAATACPLPPPTVWRISPWKPVPR